MFLNNTSNNPLHLAARLAQLSLLGFTVTFKPNPYRFNGIKVCITTPLGAYGETIVPYTCEHGAKDNETLSKEICDMLDKVYHEEGERTRSPAWTPEM